MNLKPVVASFIALGLVGSAFAATTQAEKVYNTTLTKRVAEAQAVIDENHAVSTLLPAHNWQNRITVGGLLNVEGIWGKQFPVGSFSTSGHTTNIVVNNANLFVDANINNWVKAHLNFLYEDSPQLHYSDRNQLPTSSGDHIALDEGYVTIGDFARTPFYFRAGKMYVPFGDYQRYPMIMSLTQLISQTRQTAAVLGVVTDFGLYAHVFDFQGQNREPHKTAPNADNFGGKIGYFGTMHNVGLNNVHYNVDVSYIRDIYDVDYINAFIPTYTASNSSSDGFNRVGGFGAHADFSMGPWGITGDYVTALKRLVPKNISGDASSKRESSRLWAAGIHASYGFKVLDHASKVNVGYEWTGNGEFTAVIKHCTNNGDDVYISMPHRRWVAQYDVNIWKHTDLGVAFAHDISYKYKHHPEANGSQNARKESNQAIIRLGVQF